jgi:hypothetical protein
MPRNRRKNYKPIWQPADNPAREFRLIGSRGFRGWELGLGYLAAQEAVTHVTTAINQGVISQNDRDE